MREVLAARSDRDFMVAAPGRQPRGRNAEESIAQRALSLALRHPLEVLIGLALATAGGAIAWNALVLQTARHPAPLFGPKDARGDMPAPLPPTRPGLAASHVPAALPLPAVVPSPASAPAAVSVPLPPRPSARDAIGDLIRTGESPAGSAPPSARAAAPSVTPPTKPSAVRDPIGDLIRLGEPIPVPPGLVGKVEPNRLVAAGQKALAAIGYNVKADGLMGPSTRQAIEQFERDRRLPLTGEFGPRTARELAAQSGLPVE